MFTLQKFNKLYIYNLCPFLYICYTLIKLLQQKKWDERKREGWGIEKERGRKGEKMPHLPPKEMGLRIGPTRSPGAWSMSSQHWPQRSAFTQDLVGTDG